MVLNACQNAEEIDSKHGLSTYASTTCATEDEKKKNTPYLSFRSKVMSQDPTDPKQFFETGQAVPYFTQRLETNVLTNLGQTFRSTAVQQRVNFYNQSNWYDYIPIWQWFIQIGSLFDSTAKTDDDFFDVITFNFNVEQSSLISIENVDENDNNGIVNVSIGQNVERQDIYWNQTKVITILGRVGGQAIAIIAICQFLIGHFQNFAYEREAINPT